MMLGEAYEEFARPLRGRTVAQLRQLARSANHTLPNFKEPELLIKELWAVRTGQPSPTGPNMVALPPDPQNADSPAASAVSVHSSPDASAGDAQPIVTIRAKRLSYWREARRWTPEPVRVELGEFTPEQWIRLRADANLLVR